jgi:hypothetical protein
MGSITLQYHVVFDGRFTTVESISTEDDPPAYREDLCLENALFVPTDTTEDAIVHLHDDWPTDTERELKQLHFQRQERFRQILHPIDTAPVARNIGSPKQSGPVSPLMSTKMTTTPEGASQPFVTTDAAGVVSMPSNRSTPENGMQVRSSTSTAVPPALLATERNSLPSSVIENDLNPPFIRRSERSNKGEFHLTKDMDKAYLASIAPRCSQMTHLAYLAEVSTCCDTGIENVIDSSSVCSKDIWLRP